MTHSAVHILVVLGLGFMLGGCGPEPESSGGPPASSTAAVEGPDPVRDAGALAAIQASEAWKAPRCRWLSSGAWVAADAQDTALYRAAYDAGLIDMTEGSWDPSLGPGQKAWRIALREAGKAESARCSPTSSPRGWGVPVSERVFRSGQYVGVDGVPGASNRWIYEVEFDWVPTAAGERARRDLSGHRALEEGTFSVRVYLRRDPTFIAAGGTEWRVQDIGDVEAVRLR